LFVTFLNCFQTIFSTTKYHPTFPGWALAPTRTRPRQYKRCKFYWIAPQGFFEIRVSSGLGRKQLELCKRREKFHFCSGFSNNAFW